MYFDDFQVGTEMKSPAGRTVTEADIVIFASMTGALNPLFVDEEYAKKNTSVGHRMAEGLLTLSIATGLTFQLPERPLSDGLVALMGMTFKATKPVLAGDTLYIKVVVKEKMPPKDNRGRIILHTDVTNQRQEYVMDIEGTFLIRMKP